MGGWGRGFVMALSARWRQPEAAYHGLAGREWSVVERIIDRTLVDAGVPVTVYEL